jgi:hypothetical protein
MTDSSDEIPLWLIVAGFLFFPFFVALALLGAGAAVLGHRAGNRLRAIDRGGHA